MKKLDPATAGKISEYRKIISFRNVLTHAYGAVDDETTWNIVEQKLPILRRELDQLIGQPPP